MKKFTTAFLAVFMVLGLALAGCGNSGSDDGSNENSGSDSDSSSSESVGEKVDYTITGIDPGAGVVKNSQKAVEEYGLDKWNVKTSSGSAMTAELDKAFKNKKPIVVTGWKPHWMFSKYDLKILKDPKKVFGESEAIHTVVTKGYKSENPNAYKFLDQFKMSMEDLNSVMLSIQDGKSKAEAAKAWIKDHPDKVKAWEKDVEKVDGKNIRLAYVAWASAIASNNVVKVALEDLGYKVELKQLAAGAMWSAVSKGGDSGADATVCAWLPITHADYQKQYKDDVKDLGANLEGVKLGLTVPEYMDVDSIEDLKSE
ncbi:glycine betaine ABC transporter substrate-binding protein [Tuberibacillus sp. Marseille-P3662]|uniref:glycine betaine ABC transporter substrate-binding protein n=1 Tax=Tuberibacillus sp. Marseille-P3662 TaxID=1965358 RepID=UPI000A1CAE80|nr:glycine betaine ABC transporter substrate-binding protein [Tuberibacillus sp. Marseille-P3662]